MFRHPLDAGLRRSFKVAYLLWFRIRILHSWQHPRNPKNAPTMRRCKWRVWDHTVMVNTGLGDLLGGFIAKAEPEIRLTISLAFLFKKGLCGCLGFLLTTPLWNITSCRNNKSWIYQRHQTLRIWWSLVPSSRHLFWEPMIPSHGAIWASDSSFPRVNILHKKSTMHSAPALWNAVIFHVFFIDL